MLSAQAEWIVCVVVKWKQIFCGKGITDFYDECCGH